MLAIMVALLLCTSSVSAVHSKKATHRAAAALDVEKNPTPALTSAEKDAILIRSIPDPLSESGLVLVSVGGATTPTTASSATVGVTAGLSVYSGCYESDWSTSFNTIGTSYGVDNGLLTGLYRSGITDISKKDSEKPGINMLDGVQSCTLQRGTLPASLKVSKDWWFSFGRTGWSECPVNTYMYGMYRQYRHALDYLTYIEHVECAAIDTAWSTGYGSCYTQDVTVAFDTAGWVGCAADHFITGFWRYTDQWLHGLNKIRCCKPQLGYINWAIGDWTTVCTGTLTRSVTCVTSAGTTVADSYCNTTKPATSQTCVIPDTWSWSLGEYSDYSATCGDATATRSVTCVNQDGARGDDSKCTDSKPATSKTASDLPSCPTVGEYVYGPWSACSATCGNGTWSRDVFCPADKCIGTKPDSTGECDTEVSCELIYSYSYGNWSECPVTCGEGVKTRLATCRTQWNVTVDLSECENVTALTTALPCSADDVCYFPPTTSDWGDCSASCGVGVETRTVVCDHSYCYDVPSQRSCSVADCPVFTYYWTEGDWSECSATCGTVYSTRSRACMRKEAQGLVLTAQVDDVDCAGLTEPTVSQQCLGIAECEVQGPYQYGTWSQCSATCGDGVKTRDVYCTTPSLGCYGTQPDSSVACSYGDCPTWSWSHGNWSDCSVTTCGLGTEVRSVWCENQFGGVGSAADCSEAGTQPDETATCEATNCDYPWTYTSWSDCSASCGLGVETRTVSCSGDDVTWCSGTEPSSSQECFDTICPIYSWVDGSYTDCSVTCGTGVQTRTVECQDQWGNVSASILCTDEQPDTQAACTGASVECISDYIYGSWSECSVTCGEGIKTRTVTCEGVCVGDSTSQLTCQDAVCEVDVYGWKSGDWSDCSASCGNGAKTRAVECLNQDGVVQTNTTLCTGTEPDSSETCTEISSDCLDLVTWAVGDWGSCSVTCGAGIKSRTVTCPAGDDKLCIGTKPADQADCEDGACTFLWEWARGDWSECSTQCGTGTHTRTVECLTVADGTSVDFSYCNDYQPDSEEACTMYNADYCEWQTGSWSTCNATCDATGIQTRTISCAAGADCMGVVPVSITTCAYKGDCALKFGWKTGKWSDCSESCGAKGIKTRSVKCLDSAGGSIDAALCTAQVTQPPSTKVCHFTDVANCLTWSETLWGDCSVTCGLGVRTRTVTCEDKNGQCLGGEPQSYEDCNSGACPLTSDWVVGSWSDCSETCGVEGTRTRTVDCMTAAGAMDDASNCGAEVPDTTEVCTSVDVDNCGTWTVGDFTDCPATCGTVYQTRTVTCPVTTCIGEETYTIQECPNLLPCPTYSWKTGDFDDSDCSVTCGYGTKTRSVLCVEDVSGDAVESTYCDGATPISVDTCVGDLTVCPALYKWRVGSWGDCDATCGQGNQTRSVACINQDTDSEVDGSLCLEETNTVEAPVDSKCCFAADCVNWEATTWGDCGSDDVQVRTVMCVGTLDGAEFEASACIASSTAGEMPATSQVCTESSASARR